jgi:SAM-dependent methyltransferase
MTAFAYSPQVFDVANLSDAMGIILTPEGGATTDERWMRETPYLADLILSRFDLNSESLVLDYGCGIGRLAKEIIRRTGCRVVGADISTSMRAFAAHYVNSPRFVACHPESLTLFPRFDAAISVWVLQHCFDLENDIEAIADAMEPGAPLAVVNNHARVVPAVHDNVTVWANDGKSVDDLLASKLTKQDSGKLESEFVGEAIAASAGWALYRK